MALFVHLTPERNARSILRSGLRGPRGVFCMPVLPDYYRTHQWLRELKRSGQRTIVAIDFRLEAHEPVLVGRYNQPQQETTAAAAAGLIMAAEDALGYEVIVPRAIGPGAVRRVRHLSQVLGWRYWPSAKGRRPCTCDGCLGGAEIKIRALRRRQQATSREHPYGALPFAEALLELRRLEERARCRREGDRSVYAACHLLWLIRRWKAGTPADLALLLDHPSADIVQSLARTLAVYRGRQARAMLLRLCDHPTAEVRAAATDSLIDVAPALASSLLAPYANDAAIARIMAERGVAQLGDGA